MFSHACVSHSVHEQEVGCVYPSMHLDRGVDRGVCGPKGWGGGGVGVDRLFITPMENTSLANVEPHLKMHLFEIPPARMFSYCLYPKINQEFLVNSCIIAH